MKLLKALAAVAASAGFMAASASSAVAGLVLTLDDGVNPAVVVTDNGAGDVNPNAGNLNFFGSVGVWTVNLAFARSDNGAVSASLNENLDISTSSSGAGSLTITVLDDMFSQGYSVANAVSSVTPTQSPSLDFKSTVDGVVVLDVAGLTSGASASAGAAINPLSNPFTIEHVAVITHAVGATTTFDATTVVSANEPGLLGLFGLGLIGLGIAARRRK
ncbi:MAG: hypothetical protein AAGC95_18530 [Pseudomonadota bacterium]